MVFEKYLLQGNVSSIFFYSIFFQPDGNFDYEMKDVVFDIYRLKKQNIFNSELNYHQLPKRFRNRFIQLLPSYQFQLFSFTSKQNYYDCLNLRGLECDGIMMGYLFQYKNAITTTGRLYVDYRNIPQPLLRFLRPIHFVEIYDDWDLTDCNLKPIYTTLNIDFRKLSSLQYISKFCHPALTYAHIELIFHAEIDSLNQILSCLDSVKILTIFFKPEASSAEDEEPKFSPKIAKQILENWIKKKSIALEKFVFYYQYMIVLYKQKLFLSKKHLTKNVFLTEDFSTTNNQDLYGCLPLDEKYCSFKHNIIL